MDNEGNKKTKFWGCPYTLSEFLRITINNIVGPTKKYQNSTTFIKQEQILNNVDEKFSLGFIGDIMPTENKRLIFDDSLKSFLSPTDYLIGNFEGSLFHGKNVMLGQKHQFEILDDLKNLKDPNKFFLSVANNHSADYGKDNFQKGIKHLQENGFNVFGKVEEPFIKINENISIAGFTDWSNQNENFLSRFNEIETLDKKMQDFNILYPHWGYELELYPSPNQIERAKTLLNKWDMIVGHHSHCPAPVTSNEHDQAKKLIAYSLGDFCIGKNLNKYLYGIIIKVSVGKDFNGIWKAGTVSWKFTKCCPLKNKITISLQEKCDFF